MYEGTALSLSAAFSLYQQRIQSYLSQLLAAYPMPERLRAAMQHAVLLGGKRLRPFLVYQTGLVAGAELEDLDVAAAAVELIHAYSLVHDDLPAMDNDTLRRGHPTCHIAFDEATAILAGDALQTLAFEHLATATLSAKAEPLRARLIACLARASGAQGMVGGQLRDLQATGQQQTLVELELMHSEKTGALISASCQLGSLCAGIDDPAYLQRIEGYAQALGLAFQVQDDILDIESDTETLGKPQGSDQRQAKSTYPALLGLEAAKHKALQLCTKAKAELEGLTNPMLLSELADYIITRRY